MCFAAVVSILPEVTEDDKSLFYLVESFRVGRHVCPRESAAMTGPGTNEIGEQKKMDGKKGEERERGNVTSSM